MRGLLLALGLGLAATAAAASTRPPVVVLERSVSVAPGAVTAALVTCPPRSVVLGGGVLLAEPDVQTVQSAPAGIAAWRFRLANPHDATTTATVSAVCARGLGAAGAATIRRSVTSGPAARVATVRCPPGFSPAGFGWRFAATPDTLVGEYGWVLRGAVPGAGAWAFRVVDLAAESRAASAPLALYSRCVARSAVTVRRIPALRRGARAGDNAYTYRCSRGTAAVGGGLAVRGDGWLDGVAVSRSRLAKWRVFSRSRGRGQVELYPLCLG